MMATNRYAGVDNLLTPDNHALLLIDHQYLQLMSLTSHKPATVANNATAVAKAAKVFNIPTLQTTAFAERRALLRTMRQNLLFAVSLRGQEGRGGGVYATD
jgi:hypothetical protein